MQVVKVNNQEMFTVVIEILNSSKSAVITVTGNSMSPFLQDGRDSVELVKTSFKEIRRGDIVLIKRVSGAYVLHRVLKKMNDAFYMVGDAQMWIEGPLLPVQLIARVNRMWRKNHEILYSDIRWRILGLFWLRLRTFRGFIVRQYSNYRQKFASKNSI